MNNPEILFQFNFSHVGHDFSNLKEVGLSSPDVSVFSQVINSSRLGALAIFEEGTMREMPSCALALEERLKKDGRQARIVHWQQLIPGMAKELRQPFGHYGVSPFESKPGGHCVVIVEDVSDFNEGNLKSVLEKIDQTGSRIFWFLLVPTWRQISFSRTLEEWRIEKNLPAFRITYGSSPKK